MIAASPPANRLVRPRQTMPAFVRAALAQQDLMALYKARPAYQRNDYLMWINKAKREDTRQKRLQQMLDELAGGGVYMRMAWTRGPGPKPTGPRTGRQKTSKADRKAG